MAAECAAAVPGGAADHDLSAGKRGPGPGHVGGGAAGVRPAPVAALAAFAPARFARLAAVLGVAVLVAGAVLLPVTGVAVTEIAVRGRRQHQAAARRAGYLDAINS